MTFRRHAGSNPNAILKIALAALACLIPALPVTVQAKGKAQVIHPKIVILGYFETSKKYGEKGYWGGGGHKGELYNWIEGFHLTRRLPVRGAFTKVWANADGSIIAMRIGPNSISPAVNITALGLDNRFDLTHAYWLVNGIAGTSPHTGTIGDVFWTDFVVDGDVAHQIDAREIPPSWPTGYFPSNATHPYPEPRVPAGSSADVRTWTGAFHTNRLHTVTMLNRSLLQWAYHLTSGLHLPDNATIRQVRDEYPQAAARRPPRVLVGATLSTETYWIGARLDARARRWVAYMTDGRGAYATTETNDSGTMTALTALGKAGRVDPNRVLLMRGVSDFDMPPPGVPAAQQLVRERPQAHVSHLTALHDLFETGSVVVKAILKNWDQYRITPPGR